MPASLRLTRPLAFIDLETTGIAPATDRIVEIAILKLLPSGASKRFSSRVNPGTPIPSAATAVHGITDADVALEPTFKQLAPRILELLAGCDLSGYNVRRYDLPLLRREFERAGFPLDVRDVHVVDVQTIFHMKEPRDLTAAYRYYCGKEHAGAHGALADVEATAEILRAQLDRYPDLPRDIGELETTLHAKDPVWVDDEGKLVRVGDAVVMMFGKYRGKSLGDIAQADRGYLEWILSSDFPDAVKRAVAGALDTLKQ